MTHSYVSYEGHDVEVPHDRPGKKRARERERERERTREKERKREKKASKREGSRSRCVYEVRVLKVSKTYQNVPERVLCAEVRVHAGTCSMREGARGC